MIRVHTVQAHRLLSSSDNNKRVKVQALFSNYLVNCMILIVAILFLPLFYICYTGFLFALSKNNMTSINVLWAVLEISICLFVPHIHTHVISHLTGPLYWLAKYKEKAVSTVSSIFFCCVVFKWWYCSLNILKISGSFEATTWVPISFQN